MDTLGRPIGDLLHPEDAREVERALNLKALGNQQMFVVRMRTSMAGNTRSPSKIEYKVQVLYTVHVYAYAPSWLFSTISGYC